MDPFLPTAARLGQLLAETPNEDHDLTLEFSLEVDFEEGEFDDEIGTPFLRINHLRPPGKSWKSIENQTWSDQDSTGETQNVEDLEAVILLFGSSNPVEVRQLQFGTFDSEHRIEATIQLVADFEVEAYRDSLDEVAIEVQKLSFTLEPLRISTRLEKQFRGDESETTKAVEPYLDLDHYADLEKIPGGFGYPPAS